MRVMAIIKSTRRSEAGEMPDQTLLAAMGAYNEALMQAGVLKGGEGLQPSAAGMRVRFEAGAKRVVAGPFPEVEQLVAGFWIWEVASMDDAVAWAKRCPDPMPSETAEIELRPLFEMEDFGDEMTPELREREILLRDELEREGE